MATLFMLQQPGTPRLHQKELSCDPRERLGVPGIPGKEVRHSYQIPLPSAALLEAQKTCVSLASGLPKFL